MPLTNATKARLLNGLYGNTAVAPAANLFVALSTTTPTATGGNFTRPVGGAYADVEVTNNATNWPAATDADPSVKSNGTEVVFPEATASWGEITHWGVAETADGTVVDWAPLDVAKTVDEGDTAKFEVGELKTQLQNPA